MTSLCYCWVPASRSRACQYFLRNVSAALYGAHVLVPDLDIQIHCKISTTAPHIGSGFSAESICNDVFAAMLGSDRFRVSSVEDASAGGSSSSTRSGNDISDWTISILYPGANHVRGIWRSAREIAAVTPLPHSLNVCFSKFRLLGT